MRWRPKPPPRLNNYENNRFKTVYITKNNRLDKTICEKRQIDHNELNKVLQERYPILFSS